MKRGWITWDRDELPLSVFNARLDTVRKSLSGRELPALVVYTDIWRSNRARSLSNFMPYWNRALLVIPRDAPPILICGLSPRVYPWIRSVSILDEIWPGSNLPQQLLQLCSEKRWKSLGVLDLPKLPRDIHAALCTGTIDIADVPSGEVVPSGPDECELSMYRHAVKMGRNILTEELATEVEGSDYELAGRLERRFRRAGAEDLVILFASGQSPPLPARGSLLGGEFSVALALEYRGHWIKLARPHTSARASASIRSRFDRAVSNLKTLGPDVRIETLSGAYPYELCDPSELRYGSLLALHVEAPSNGLRLFFGDTCLAGEKGGLVL